MENSKMSALLREKELFCKIVVGKLNARLYGFFYIAFGCFTRRNDVVTIIDYQFKFGGRIIFHIVLLY